MLFKGIVTEASGSIGGITAARNRGGLYFRGRGIPVNTNTGRQQAVRNALTSLSQAWANTLTQTQRDAWDLYAQNVPLVGPLGDARQVSGLAQYVRSNVPRIQAGLPRVDDGPTTFTLAGSLANLTLLVQEGAIRNAIFSAVELDTGDAILAYLGRPRSPGRRFFAGPFRYAGLVDAAAPPESISTMSLDEPYLLTEGQRVTARFLITRGDGRLGAPSDAETIVVAP